MNPNVDILVEAWTNPGPYPIIHERAKNRLKQDWPVLYNAIVDLVQGRGNNPDEDDPVDHILSKTGQRPVLKTGWVWSDNASVEIDDMSEQIGWQHKGGGFLTPPTHSVPLIRTRIKFKQKVARTWAQVKTIEWIEG